MPSSQRITKFFRVLQEILPYVNIQCVSSRGASKLDLSTRRQRSYRASWITLPDSTTTLLNNVKQLESIAWLLHTKPYRNNQSELWFTLNSPVLDPSIWWEYWSQQCTVNRCWQAHIKMALPSIKSSSHKWENSPCRICSFHRFHRLLSKVHL